MAGYDQLVRQRKPVLRYVVGAGLLILLAVLVWIAVASVRNDSPPRPASSGSSSTSKDADSSSGPAIAPNSASENPSTTPTSAPNGDTQPAPQGQNPAATPTAHAASNPQLAETGPGQTVAIFFAATFLGWLIHYRHTKTRLRSGR